MGKNELVSVIIPVYNVQPYLCEALNSVIHQTYENLEIIIIDDGSTDGSGKICDEYAERDPRIKVFHQENKGLSNARNTGLDWMTGEVVAFLDPDDAYEFTFIEKLKTAMDRERADLAVCKYTVYYTTEKMIRGIRENLEPQMSAGVYDRIDMLVALSDRRVNASVWNKLYKRKLWEEIRFQDGHVCEDNEASYRVINESRKTVVVDSPLYYHRNRPGSITANLTRKLLKDQILAVSRVKEFVTENLSDMLPEEYLQKIRQTCLNSMMGAYARLFKVREDFDKKTEGEKLRQQIIKIGEEIEMNGCKNRTKIAYQMICFCPWLLRIVYPVYRPIRTLVYKLIGR